MDKSRSREEIRYLVEKYRKIINENRINKYTEEDTKAEFIEPLFSALGWDTKNTLSNDEVTREEKISKERVDYSFRINGIPKFFLEAKSLKANLDNPEFSEQAITYSWNKGCTWAVLTDFEAIKIFNCEWQTNNFDYSKNHLKTIQFNEYIDRFDELLLLSRESFANGLLDKEAEKWGKKTRKSSVDEQLLLDFTNFREILSQDITRLNKDKILNDEEIDESIQRILDRLIFIRNCEDRQMEEIQLLPILRTSKSKDDISKELRKIFRYYDRHYNSKIFTDHLCDNIKISNEVLRSVIDNLYYTKDKSISYDFSVIESDVLGKIYEQYLSHVLKIISKKSKLVNNPEVRREHGIYYTPNYVVDYILKQTLQPFLEDKKNKINKLHLLDPACGSGSFLIKAFDLLNRYRKERDKEYSQVQLDPNVSSGTYSKKLQIIENNIFGVDIDKQAIEVSQLNLLLKVAEKGQRLPLLQQNIKRGNSLVDDDKLDVIFGFDWNHNFNEIMGDGGFDIIVGNPPYEVLLKSKTNALFLDYIKNKYTNPYLLENKNKSGYWSSEYNPNLFALFLEKSLNLLKEGGYLGFIIQNSLFSNIYFKNIRKLILDQCVIREIVDFRFDVFEDVVVDSTIIILKKEKSKKQRDKNKVRVYLNVTKIEDLYNSKKLQTFEQSFFDKKKTDYRFSIYLEPEIFKIIAKMDEVKERMEKYIFINRGIGLGGGDEPHKLSIIKDSKTDPNDKQVYIGKDVSRYTTQWTGKWARIDGSTTIGGTRNPLVYETKEKILLPRIRNLKYKQRILAGLDTRGFWALDNYNIIRIKDQNLSIKYLLGVLNSKLINFYFRNVYVDVNIKGDFLEKVPIIVKNDQTELIKLVEEMLSLQKRLKQIEKKKTDEVELIISKIKQCDKIIDDAVFSYYNISSKEKEIIENNMKEEKVE